jgi:two-component system response regulator DesR
MTADAPIRVLLAEDQGMMRSALALLLNLEPDIEVVAQVASGTEVVDAAIANRADIALLDIEMPGMSGLDAAAALRTARPDCRVLILTTFGRPGYLRRAMEAGASGFLVKDGPVNDLATAIRDVLAGRNVVDPALAAAALAAGPNPLTDRERDVLTAAVDGSTIADIAKRLHLSESTVRTYLSSAIGKTNTRNRIEAIRTARSRGWLKSPGGRWKLRRVTVIARDCAEIIQGYGRLPGTTAASGRGWWPWQVRAPIPRRRCESTDRNVGATGCPPEPCRDVPP